jgi:Plasmid recombination enzyme
MYQFIHISSFSSQASKKSKSSACVKSIVSEADRKPSYTHHIEVVEAPIILFGCSPSAAGDIAESWGKRNKIRKDGHVLLAGVISVNTEFEHWDDYKLDCIRWLGDKYGDRLQSVVEHTDEGHPHMHFYVIPRDGERFDCLHEGEKARNDARALKQRTCDQNIAYKTAMKNFQSNFHSAVSRIYGLAKDGPKRRRLSRAAYFAEKEAVNIVSAAHLDQTNTVEQGQQERSRIIEQTKREAVEYIATQKKLAADTSAKIMSEAVRDKQQATKLGWEQGRKTFERQPLIKKIRAVLYGLTQLANKQLKRIQQQLSNTKDQANSRLSAARKEIAGMKAEIARKDERIQHVSTLYDEVCKQKIELLREAKKSPALNFAASANLPDHLQTPK